MAHVVIAHWTVRAGEEQHARALLLELAPLARAEPGCRLFQPTFDPTDPRQLTILEIYDDEAAFEAHGRSAHFKRYVLEEGVPLLEKRERTLLRTIDEDGA
jgi:quinol monooxygenase YgiN